MTSALLLTGDCRELLPKQLEGSVASIVTDPPYRLTGATRFGKTRSERGFMNKTWDGGDVAFAAETWATMLPLVRPGGYLLAFGGTRTCHRLACAIEDGGWEIVDSIAWLYGQGFPKHDSKLKPAFEPIVMAKAPGPIHSLSIDDCRIAFADADDEAEAKIKNRHADFGSGARENAVYGADNRARSETGNYDAPGRWPANVCLDETAAEMLDEQSGVRASGNHPSQRRGIGFTENGGGMNTGTVGESRSTGAGGASRFFYCPKASRSEREAGLGTTAERQNTHPTVKPIALMRWLVRLITPPGGVVLDPFMGSGSTGAACALEDFGFIGTDITPEYVAIAARRIIHWRPDDLFAVEVG